MLHSTNVLAEADRLMTICNSCRYCEGLCAVFPSMELRRDFTDGDLNYLANLCHGCGACFFDCQYSPPHEFNVNVPATLAAVRADSYGQYAWPRVFAGAFARNGVFISVICAASVALFVAGFMIANDSAVVWGTHAGRGAFYRLMPHAAMTVIFGGAFLYAVVALLMGVRSFWRDTGAAKPASPPLEASWQAIVDGASLRYLDGGGKGCMTTDEQPTDRRRVFHHLTFYGFGLCFVSTSLATGYHYLLGLEAPYPWYDLPVLTGTAGGIAMLIGSLGLLYDKGKRLPELGDPSRRGMEAAFILMLFLTSLTGLALLVLRETPIMGLTLAVHLGVVFALFVTMPYGKFAHGIYRFAALLRHAKEMKVLASHGGTQAT